MTRAHADEIDFLPSAYQQARQRKAQLLREVVLVGACLMLMTTWYLSVGNRTQDLEDYARSIETQVESLRKQSSEFNRLTSTRNNLSKQVRMQRELGWPVGYTQIAAVVVRQMPEAVTLTNLSISGQRPQIEQPKPALVVPRPASNREGATPAQPVVTVEMVGVAPSDSEVADLVGRLSDHPLFQDVKLHYSRPSEIANYRARAFHIEMEVPMDRDYQSRSGGGAG